MEQDATAGKDSRGAGGRPARVGELSPVAAKAAAIDAERAHPLTWKTVVKRAIPVAVAGAAICAALHRTTHRRPARRRQAARGSLKNSAQLSKA
jgi:hypothetical protein